LLLKLAVAQAQQAIAVEQVTDGKGLGKQDAIVNGVVDAVYKGVLAPVHPAIGGQTVDQIW
jgi:hypothetical protein